jgi:hypothetical protein
MGSIALHKSAARAGQWGCSETSTAAPNRTFGDDQRRGGEE